MNNFFFKATPVWLVLLCSAISSFSQTLQTDADRQNILETTVTGFYKALGEQSRLYNGPEYEFYDPNIQGTAYFNDIKKFVPGTVVYDGFVYKNVPLLYDIYKDYVVILLPNKSANISLLSDRVQSFDLSGHHFINISADTLTNNKAITTGFYDLLYKGKIEVVVKRSKSVQNNSVLSTKLETYFSENKKIYIKKNNAFFNVSSKNSFLNVLSDKKKEIRQYIKNNQIDFGDDQEMAMAKVAAYYDQITR